MIAYIQSVFRDANDTCEIILTRTMNICQMMRCSKYWVSPDVMSWKRWHKRRQISKWGFLFRVYEFVHEMKHSKRIIYWSNINKFSWFKWNTLLRNITGFNNKAIYLSKICFCFCSWTSAAHYEILKFLKALFSIITNLR